VASKAKGPALAVGATAAGVAGGLLIRSHTRQKKVLGVPVPRSLGKPDVDVKSLAKSVGKASKQFGQTTKTVSKDMERVGDQAERIAKILG
jgi:1-aminocyclopropane-1-carboxylate deaminase/D-cysteine desulfhydrase-like pyridoxal-dependent ACC family enzyme